MVFIFSRFAFFAHVRVFRVDRPFSESAFANFAIHSKKNSKHIAKMHASVHLCTELHEDRRDGSSEMDAFAASG